MLYDGVEICRIGCFEVAVKHFPARRLKSLSRGDFIGLCVSLISPAPHSNFFYAPPKFLLPAIGDGSTGVCFGHWRVQLVPLLHRFRYSSHYPG